ncbi:MAG: leucyl aminopeptidase [Planctomycetota bacterium]|nr:leucyl aminopeptidase [Planctomycetota bacterium]
MKLSVKERAGKLGRTDLCVVFATKGRRPELPEGVEVSAAARKDFTAEFRANRLCDPVAGDAKRVLLVGLGEAKSADAESLRRAAAIAAKEAERLGVASVTCFVGEAVEKTVGGAEAAGAAVAEGLVMGSYRYDELKSKRKKPSCTAGVLLGAGADFKRGVRLGRILGEANCYTRDLQNRPGNKMRPRDFASEARKLARKGGKITTKVLSEKQMADLGMGSLLSVSAGSIEPAQLVHMTYKPKGKSKGRLALVGKGLTFDSGGISLKPGARMDEMKFDMSGGAAVMGVFHALCSLDLPYEIHGVVPASENMPANNATKPGDVVTAMNGRTIEVINTDAEGRLILADALVYTSTKIKPDTIIDLATLTGAVVVALGHELSGMFPTTRKLAKELTASGERTGELVWELPLLDCHKDQMKGVYGDLRNINSGQGNGSTTGAAFLSNFVGEGIEWCHLDIAGSAWGGQDRDYRGGKTGSGVGVRLLIDYISNKA